MIWRPNWPIASVPIPDPVDNLFFQLRIKVLATKAGITSVTTDSGQIRIRLGLDQMRLYQIQRYLGENVRVSKSAVWLGRDLSTHEWQVRLVQVLEKLGGDGSRSGWLKQIRPNNAQTESSVAETQLSSRKGQRLNSVNRCATISCSVVVCACCHVTLNCTSVSFSADSRKICSVNV